jgi:dipeptidyl aminopeptidase/acylaminoacyl peptidase
MRGKLFTVDCLLLSACLTSALLSACFLLSCSSTPTPPPQTELLIYRFDPPAFIEYSADFQPIHEIPFSVPPNCGLNNTFPAPIGQYMVIELNCPNGQTVLFLDTSASLSAGSESGAITQPVTDSDAHFLAWTPDGEAAYLKVDSLGNPQIIRAHMDGAKDILAISEFTYDLSARPDSRDFIFTFSGGLGYGSELHLARNDGRSATVLYADQYNYISFARFSPDGKQIAFIKIPDTQTPFTVGELWVIEADGANARKLADADAGHGYAANWSPDGKRIAFVARENPQDENADQVSDALISNIYIIDVETDVLTQVTNIAEGYVETPFWSPDGNTLAFNVVMNGRMNVSIADVASGEIRSLETGIAPVGGSTCCPAWIRK